MSDADDQQSGQQAEDAGETRDVLVYTTEWCGDSRRAVSFLDEHEIAYRAIDIDEDEDAANAVEALNGGYRSTPTILINGEHVATEPRIDELAKLFGIKLAKAGKANRPSWLRRHER